MKNPKNTTHTKRQSKTPSQKKASQIKLGMDLSARWIVVARQVDGATPQPAQKFNWEEFPRWAKKQLSLADEVYSCYEAGPFGYGLHRELEEMGIQNVVITPVKLDPENKRVKTDRTDAQELCARLDRYVGGNSKALSVVRVPTPEQELERSQSRQREQIQEHRKRWEAQGRSLLLYYGYRIQGRWWEKGRWEKLKPRFSEKLLTLLEPLQQEALHLWELEVQHTCRLAESMDPIPLGFGQLTQELLNREMLGWEGFTNRRQVGSITGLCPGVSASGGMRREGPVTKRGRRRVRTLLIELAWRLVQFQPEYPPVKEYYRRTQDTRSRAVRKKAVVALARKAAIDQWRMATGRCTAEELGLKLKG